MSSKVFKYILDFQGNTQKFSQQIGGVKGLMKGAAVAAGAMFAVDKIMDAADAVADYALEISHVRNEVGQLTGANGAALETMTGQVKAIADAYKVEVNESLAASNAMMQAFGENSQSTFNIINAGFATTANSNDDFLKQVSEYSIHFKEAGLAASEMVAVIAEGNKMGVFDDKAADAIKEGSIRLREMTQGTRDALNMIGLSADTIEQSIKSGSMSMFEVMQLVSKQLNMLPAQSSATGTALADIFGGPGEDAVQFIRNLENVNINLDEVVDSGGKAAAAQMQWANELAEFHKIGSTVFGGTGQMITQVKGIMLGWVNDGIRGLVNLANYFIDLYNESAVFRGSIEYIKLVFKTNFDLMKTILGDFWNRLKSVGKLVKAVFTGDFEAIPEILKNTFSSTVDTYKDYGKKVAENFKTAVENTLNPREKIKMISLTPSEAVEAGVNAANNFVQGFKQRASSIPAIETKQSKGVTQTETLNVDTSSLDSMTSFMDKNTEKANQLSSAMQGFLNPEGLGAMSENFFILGQNIGGAAGSFLGFASNMLQLIPQMIMQIMALGSAEVAQSAATTTAKGTEAITSGVAQSQKVPFPLNLVALAATMAAVVGALSSAKSFATGGIVPGISYHGDNVLARLNSGEEVLRRDDPRHSFNQRATQSGNSGGRDRLILGDVKWSKGALYFALREAENQLYKRTGRRN